MWCVVGAVVWTIETMTTERSQLVHPNDSDTANRQDRLHMNAFQG